MWRFSWEIIASAASASTAQLSRSWSIRPRSMSTFSRDPLKSPEMENLLWSGPKVTALTKPSTRLNGIYLFFLSVPLGITASCLALDVFFFEGCSSMAIVSWKIISNHLPMITWSEDRRWRCGTAPRFGTTCRKCRTPSSWSRPTGSFLGWRCFTNTASPFYEEFQ